MDSKKKSFLRGSRVTEMWGLGEKEKKYIAVRLSADLLDFSGCDGAEPPPAPQKTDREMNIQSKEGRSSRN
jgi:hypothetical protein